LNKSGVNLAASTGSAAKASFGQGSVGAFTLVQVNVDYTIAPIPTQAYLADYVAVRPHRTGFVLVFGKLNGAGDALRTQIEVIFPKQTFNSQLWQSSVPLRDTLFKLNGVTANMSRPELPDAEKTQTVAANNVFMATTLEEAVLDFYYLSPRGIFFANVTQSNDVGDLEAVIRISTDASLLREFLDRCKPYVEEGQSNVQVKYSR
jgi:hypothetical protein